MTANTEPAISLTRPAEPQDLSIAQMMVIASQELAQADIPSGAYVSVAKNSDGDLGASFTIRVRDAFGRVIYEKQANGGTTWMGQGGIRW